MINMKINFILPSLNPSGGVKVVKDYCTWLNEHGHDCRIYYPFIEYLKHRHKYKYAEAGLFALGWADITIATAWETAKTVLDLPDCCGKKAYFIQHYESIWDNRAEETYKYPLNQIVVSHWLYKTMWEEFKTSSTIVENGVFMPILYKNTTKDYISILMPHREEWWKDTRIGMKVLAAIHKQYPAVKIRVFGFRIKSPVPDYIEVYQNPTDTELKELYYDTDIFFSPSMTEGFGLPALEAMAYMCAVVTTNVGAVPEYTHHGEFAYLVHEWDFDGMYKALSYLIENPKYKIGLQVLGREYVEKRYTFDLAAKRFEQCLISLVQS